MVPDVQDIAAVIGIIATVSGAIVWLFKVAAINPLKNSIDDLNQTIKEVQRDMNKRMSNVESRVDTLENHDTRHEERLKTILERMNSHA